MDQGFPNRYKGWGKGKFCWGNFFIELWEFKDE